MTLELVSRLKTAAIRYRAIKKVKANTRDTKTTVSSLRRPLQSDLDSKTRERRWNHSWPKQPKRQHRIKPRTTTSTTIFLVRFRLSFFPFFVFLFFCFSWW